jgi:hypothetical protein
MFPILQQPFPKDNDVRRLIRNSFIGGFWVFVFLIVFKPVGFANAPVGNLYLFASYYGIITTVTVLISVGVTVLFPNAFREEKWTVGKNILLYTIIVVVIGTLNYLFTIWYFNQEFSSVGFVNFQFFTFAVTVFVVSGMTMTKFFLSQKFYMRHAIEMDEEIKEISHQSKDELLKFTSENNKEVLEIKLNDLLYIESADNYSKFYFRKNGQVASSILRTSLSRVEKMYSHAELFRCHRTYIVQLRNVERISGNSQGYRFHFAGVEVAVPVSRRLNEVIHERLAGVKE